MLNRRDRRRVPNDMRLLFLLTCAASLGAAEDPREIVRRAMEADRRNQDVARNYTYVERVVTVNTRADGSVKKREVRTYDVTLSEGTPYRRLIEIDDKPLPPEMERKEREKLEKSIEERRHESASARAKRVAEWEKKRRKQREFVDDLLQAMDFQLLGEEEVRGRKAWVVGAAPHPGYRPHSRETSFLTKVKGKLWIDQHDSITARLDAEFTDDVSFGVFLAKLHKGSRFVFEQVPVNGEVWLPTRLEGNFSARVVFSRLRASLEMDFSKYRKFQADSRIIVNEPAPASAP